MSNIFILSCYTVCLDADIFVIPDYLEKNLKWEVVLKMKSK